MKIIENQESRLKLVLNILVLSLSLYGVSRTDIANRQTSFFDKFMIDSFAVAQSGITHSKRKLSSVIDHYFINISASKENEHLKKRVSSLENKIFQLQEIDKENQRLKELLRFGGEIPQAKVLAKIVGWDASSDLKVLRINKGLSDGIKLQSTVVTAEGVVGYIYRLTENFSDILTILDNNNKIDGIIKRTRSHGIVEGYKGGRCLVKYVTRTEPVILNDLVLTSGLGNIYPKGIRIGKISRIERESYGITQHIEITPNVDFSRLEEVVVLVSKDTASIQEEWKALNDPSKRKQQKKGKKN